MRDVRSFTVICSSSNHLFSNKKTYFLTNFKLLRLLQVPPYLPFKVWGGGASYCPAGLVDSWLCAPDRSGRVDRSLPPPLCPAWPRAGWGKHCVDCCPSAVLSWWNSVPCSVSVRWLAHPGTSTVGSVASPTNYCTLLEKLTDDAQLYVTKFSTISLYLTKLYSSRQRHQSHAAKSSTTFLTVYTYLVISSIATSITVKLSSPHIVNS